MSTIWAEIGPKEPENEVKGNIWGQLALYNAPYRAEKMRKRVLFPQKQDPFKAKKFSW